jgi:dienelactone hydrolase
MRLWGMGRPSPAGLLLACAIGCTRTHAEPARAPSEIFISGKAGKLQAWLWRPAGRGPFPALVYNHGSEKDPIAGTAGDIGPYFSSRGFVVLFPSRRGAGKSEGRYWKDRVDAMPEAEQEQATIDELVAQNDDVVSAIEYLRAQPFVDRSQVSVAGCSFGGIETLLTAERPLTPPLYAAVDFAGGAIMWSRSPRLRARLLQAAQHARVPVFFVQAENDFNTAPSQVLSAAMKEKNLPHRVRIFPPHGTTHMEGHGQFCLRGASEWGADVLDFLKNRR